MTERTAYRPWHVLHIDLSDGVPALEHDPDHGGIHVVLWAGGVPLGALRILSEQLPMTPEHLRALAADEIAPAVGARLVARGFEAEREWGPPGAAVPDLDELIALDSPLERLQRVLGERWRAADADISVVVCTRNRPAELARCLDSLLAQSLQPREVIVVDNARDGDATRDLVAARDGVRYVAEPRLGLAAARNTGVRASGAELIAFTDDDVVVDSEWLRRLVPAFDDPRVMCATGLVLPAELATEPQWFFEYIFGGFGRGFRPILFDSRFVVKGLARGVPAWSVGAGANMAFRREAFRRVGEFDERLGAGASGCSEDSELWYRLLAAGHACRYEPASVVHHYHRRDARALERQMHEYMRGHVAALFVQFERHRHRGNLRRVFVTLPNLYARRAVGRVVYGPIPHHRTLAAEVRGCGAGAVFYLSRLPRRRKSR